MQKNSQLNLSAIRDEEGIFVKHICDALAVQDAFSFEKKKSLIDVWTGSGFPLLPIAITNPELNCVWIDSVRKKVHAVNDMISSLHLTNVQAVWTRIEDYKSPQFDYLTARAVAYVDQLLDRSYDLVKIWGYFILYKQSKPEERKSLITYCENKSLVLEKEYTYTLFDGDVERVIYILKK